MVKRLTIAWSEYQKEKALLSMLQGVFINE